MTPRTMIVLAADPVSRTAALTASLESSGAIDLVSANIIIRIGARSLLLPRRTLGGFFLLFKFRVMIATVSTPGPSLHGMDRRGDHVVVISHVAIVAASSSCPSMSRRRVDTPGVTIAAKPSKRPDVSRRRVVGVSPLETAVFFYTGLAVIALAAAETAMDRGIIHTTTIFATVAATLCQPIITLASLHTSCLGCWCSCSRFAFVTGGLALGPSGRRGRRFG